MRRIDFLSRSFLEDPWPVYAEFRSGAPVWWCEPIQMFCVFSHAAVKQALTSPDFTVRYPFRISRQVFGETLLDLDGPRHRSLRKLLARFLSGHLENPSFVGAVDDSIDLVLGEIAGSRRVDFVAAVAARLPMLTTAAFLGIPRERCDEVRSHLDYLLQHLDGSGGDFGLVVETRRELESFVRGLMCQEPPVPGMIGLLRSYVAGGQLAEPEAVGLVLLTLAAGVETSTGLLANSMACFGRHPRWVDAARGDPAVLRRFLREVARWEPPQHDTVRFAVRDTTLGDVRIPAASPLKVILASANRDELVYARAEEFDPDRAETSTLSFGHGLHSCLGTHMALQVAQRLFGAFLVRMRFAYLDEPYPIITGSTFRRPKSMRLELAEAEMIATQHG